MRKNFTSELRRSNRRRGADLAHWGALYLVRSGKWVAVIPRTDLDDWHRDHVNDQLYDTPQEASHVARAAWARRSQPKPAAGHITAWGICHCERYKFAEPERPSNSRPAWRKEGADRDARPF